MISAEHLDQYQAELMITKQKEDKITDFRE